LRLLLKVFKVVGLTYIGSFIITAVHFPTSTKQSFLETRPHVLLLPITTIGIIRAYGQFAFARTWPFGARRDVVFLDGLIASKGIQQFAGSSSRAVIFDFNPEIRPGQEGRTVYSLTSEGYNKTFYGAFASSQNGGLLRIGRYFCLMRDANSVILQMGGPSDCYELVQRSGIRFYWRKLGKTTEHAVLLSR